MDRLYLGLAIHNHQPVGNFGKVFEFACEKAYLPFLEALERHPKVRLSLHYSGCLLDWMSEHRPDVMDRLGALAARGQVEVMTGGYYEPILPVIPDADKIGQVAKLSGFIQQRFGQQAEGLWLAERVWEPHLPKALQRAGVRWTILDDTHFKLAGLRDDALGGYYMTEEEGHAVKVFPSSKTLRYIIPWRNVSEVIAHLGQLAEQGCALVAMGDDGEKFGSWPTTYEHCWQKGWVDEFFSAVERCDWLEAIPLGEYARRTPPLGTVYLPTASYDEMMEWALPTPARLEFAHLMGEFKAADRQDVLGHLFGGFWRNFLTKYPESNAMHKKMLLVHRKVAQAQSLGLGAIGQDDLWKGQCNCAYWHGVFGGLYLSHMRRADYHNLISAENAVDAALHPAPQWLAWRRVDYDGDGRDELLVEGHLQNLYLHPELGGHLTEWDLMRPAVNLVDTLARRPEAYHGDLQKLEASRQTAEDGNREVKTIHEMLLAKENGLGRLLVYDSRRRSCLIDHILSSDVSLEAFADSQYDELGDFADGAYESQVEARDGGLVLRLIHKGHVHGGTDSAPLSLQKELHVAGTEESLQVKFQLSGPTAAGRGLVFASEWNLGVTQKGYESLTFRSSGAAGDQALGDPRGEKRDVTALSLRDPYVGVALTLEMEPAATVWHFPVQTVSISEEGFERTFQGGCLVFLWPALSAGERDIKMVWRWERYLL